jgi:hypothetical protein
MNTKPPKQTSTSVPGLVEQVVAGPNGTRIYEWNGRYYLIDGEFDCRRPGEELPDEAWANLEQARETAKREWR